MAGLAAPLVVRLHGRIDAADCDVLVAQLETGIAIAARARQRLVIDLAGVSFIASHGLAALARADQQARAHGVTVLLARPDARLRELLTIAGHDHLFEICERLPQ